MTIETAATIQALSGIFMVLIALVGLRQIHLFKKSTNLDHERSRRHQSVQDCIHWNENLTVESSNARRLCEELDVDHFIAMKDNKGFSIDKKLSDIAKVALSKSSEPTLNIVNNTIQLSATQSLELRNLVITHLNLFELTVAGWYLQISDRAVLEDQLCYVVDVNRGWKMLEGFRTHVTGLEAYKATHNFVEAVSNKQNSNKSALLNGSSNKLSIN